MAVTPRVPVAPLVLALLVLTPFAAAAAEEWTAREVAEDAPPTATAWNTQRKLVRDADGTLHAVLLVAAGDKEGARVEVLRSRDGGVTWEREGVPAPSTNATLRPTLATGPHGLWVAWTEFLPDEKHHQVFAARLVDGEWKDKTRLSHTLGYSGYPSLAVTENGTVHAAWYGLDQGYYQVFHRARALDGSWSTPVRLSPGFPDAVNPALALGPDGALTVTWYKQEARFYQVWMARRAPDGEWSNPVTISEGNAHSSNPSIVVDAGNVAHVAWDRKTEDGTRSIWVASARAGAFTGKEMRVLPVDEPAGSFPSLALDADGRVVAAWTAPDGIRVARRGDDGAWNHVATLGNAGARDANLRWQPLHQAAEPLELVFTDDDGEGGLVVRHATLGESPAAVEPRGERVISGAGSVVSLLALATVCLLRPRPSQREEAKKRS